jgi:hypothetical protein
MAHLIVSAAGMGTADGTVVVVTVSGSEDGLPRTGLVAEDVVITQVPDLRTGVPAVRPIERLLEGPEGCYSLLLAPASVAADGLPRRELFTIAVHGSTQTGWADEHGLAVATSA